MAIKRLRYYDHQFLVVNDFTDEQAYQLGMRRRHARLLHAPGIASGLAVQKTGNLQVTVRAGEAVDAAGRELVLETDRVFDLAFAAGTTVFVSIAYREVESDPSTSTTAPGNTRITEDPLVEARNTAPAGPVVRLAQFTLGTGGSVPDGPLDGGVRQGTGARLAAGSVAESNLDPALQAKVNSPQGLVSLDGVSNPGGNIDLLAVGGITLTPNDAANTITIGQNITAGQIGALLSSQYDLGRRSIVDLRFTENDNNGAQRSQALPFVPRFVLAVANCRFALGNVEFSGGSVGFFDALSNTQRCFHFGADRMPTNDLSWFMRPASSIAPLPPVAGICSFALVDRITAPPGRGDNLLLTAAATATGVTVTLTKTVAPPATTSITPLDLLVSLVCMGPLP